MHMRFSVSLRWPLEYMFLMDDYLVDSIMLIIAFLLKFDEWYSDILMNIILDYLYEQSM